MYTQVLLKNRKPDRIITMEEYRQDSGYTALSTALSEMRYIDVEQVILFHIWGSKMAMLTTQLVIYFLGIQHFLCRITAVLYLKS